MRKTAHDYYPKLTKRETLPLRIFKILNIKEDQYDGCKQTDSGGGSTFTKHGLGKILRQIELLQAKHPSIFKDIERFEEHCG